MIVFSEIITPRLRYILDFFQSEISNEPWDITSNADEFKSASFAKINYSSRPFETDCLHIIPHQLLFETGVTPQNTDCAVQKGVPVFFQQPKDFGFDIFAASFYLLSRYEEYLPHAKDRYGRYAHENALAYNGGFLGKPLINIWLEAFKTIIKDRFQGSTFKKSSFHFVPSYDIDMAWNYRHKGFLRNGGGMVKDLFRLHFSAIKSRIQVLAGMRPDPYDTFSWLNRFHEQYGLKPYYFFLVADKFSTYENNIPPHHPAMKKLIADTVIRHPVGLHPSWNSGEDLTLLQREKNVLANITGTTINASRQHYLRISLPDTYRNLIKAGLLFDFSMGYSGVNGFRASVASPFKWYDLMQEEATTLTLFPFCYMEGASIVYKKETPGQALTELKILYQEVKAVNGFFCSIWHNHSLSNIGEFAGWRDMYEEFVAGLNEKSNLPAL